MCVGGLITQGLPPQPQPFQSGEEQRMYGGMLGLRYSIGERAGCLHGEACVVGSQSYGFDTGG